MLADKRAKAGVASRVATIRISALSVVVFAGGIMLAGGSRANAQQGDSGAALYKTKCIACHAADGSGNTPVGKSLKSADLRSTEVQTKSNADLADFVATGKGNMPSFKSSTTDDEIQAIVAYVRTFAAKKPRKAESKTN